MEDEILKPRPHGLAIRQGFTGTIPNANQYDHHAGTYECTCGTKYEIFVDLVHLDCGERFGRFVGQYLDYVHKNGGPHPDVIGIPMEAEFVA